MRLWRAGHGLYLMRRNAHFMSLAGKIIRKILAALSNSGLALCKSMQVTRCRLLRVCNCIFSKTFGVVDVWGVGAKPYHTILAVMSINCWVIRACHLWLRVRSYGTHWYIECIECIWIIQSSHLQGLHLCYFSWSLIVCSGCGIPAEEEINNLENDNKCLHFSQTLQLRVKFVKHEAEQERMWEDQHEWAADRLYSLCTELGGFFLKVKHLICWCSESLGNFLFAWFNELQWVGYPQTTDKECDLSCCFFAISVWNTVHAEQLLCYHSW